MERLTFDGNFCDITQCLKTPGGSVMAHQVMDYTVTEGGVPIAYCAGDTLADGTTHCGRFAPDDFGRGVFLPARRRKGGGGTERCLK